MLSVMNKSLMTIMILTNVSAQINCLYFHVTENEKRCFLQELPSNTLLVGNYKCRLFDTETQRLHPQNHQVGMVVEVRDPEKQLILLRWYKSDGRFSLISEKHGEHTVCLHSNGSASGSQIRVYLDLQTGEHAYNYTNIARTENLSELETKLRQLIDQAREIAKEQSYQRYREEMFRGTTECISMRVLLWSIGQTIILVIMAVWQMQNLKEFLESKKLV